MKQDEIKANEAEIKSLQDLKNQWDSVSSNYEKNRKLQEAILLTNQLNLA
jgi:hypothetical protein